MSLLVNGNWISTLGLTKEQFSVIILVARNQKIERSETYEDDYEQCIQNPGLIVINNQLCTASSLDIKKKKHIQLSIKEWFFSNSANNSTHVFYNESVNMIRVAELLRENPQEFKCNIVNHSCFGNKAVDLIKSHWKIINPVSPEFIQNRAVEKLIREGVKSAIAYHSVHTLQKAGLLKNID